MPMRYLDNIGRSDMEQSVGSAFAARIGDEVAGNDRSTSRGSWLHAHEELVKLAKKRAGLDFEEGRWLLCAFRSEAHARLAYGSFAEYIERLFGYSPRQTQEKLRVAEALEDLPNTAQELRAGKISFSAVRELTRVATAETEREWLDAARDKTVREVEALVSGQRPGALPDDLPDDGAKRHVLRFDVSADVLATFREAMTKIRRDAGESLDDDAALLLLARCVLGAPRTGVVEDGGNRDEGRSSYRIALTICEICRRGHQQARGQFLEVPADVVAMACCDAQHIGQVTGSEEVDGKTRALIGTETDVTENAQVDHRQGAARNAVTCSAWTPLRILAVEGPPSAPAFARLTGSPYPCPFASHSSKRRPRSRLPADPICSNAIHTRRPRRVPPESAPPRLISGTGCPRRAATAVPTCTTRAPAKRLIFSNYQRIFAGTRVAESEG